MSAGPGQAAIPGPFDSAGRIAEMTRAGIAAALRVARAQGLPADDPRLLSSRGSVLVHLAPVPVVARVSTGSAWTRADPFAWLEREVLAAGFLSAQGAPVMAPTDLADPGPHRCDGHVVSLWELLPPSADRPEPREVGRSLAQLHAAAIGFTTEMPDLVPIRDFVTEGLDILRREQLVEAGMLAALLARHDEVMREIDAMRAASLPLLHGDSHAGNLLRSGSGWAWIDLEETCSGPPEFDLAIMIASTGGGSWAPGQDRTLPSDAQIALRAYAAELGVPVPGLAQLAPFIRARRLEEVVWLLGMDHLYPERYREHVPGSLARALDG